METAFFVSLDKVELLRDKKFTARSHDQNQHNCQLRKEAGRLKNKTKGGKSRAKRSDRGVVYNCSAAVFLVYRYTRWDMVLDLKLS